MVLSSEKVQAHLKWVCLFFCCHAYEKMIRWIILSANQSGTLKECKPEAQHAFSEMDKIL
ncbi:MAG TPA: hypothetical protein DEW33_10935 [Lachnospiraceae bacterium]|nr:hypothetical protein [Lachnospiraceae bacterium]